MNYKNQHHLPKSIVEVIKNTTYDVTKSDPKRLSISVLINSPRIRQLTLNHWGDLEEDVSNYLWRITGNAYHYILGKVNEENRLIEETLEEKIGDITIVGRPDIYDKKIKSIEDYKITSVWSVKGNEIKKEWETQLNSYGWLLRKKKYEVEKGFINAILRDHRKIELKRFKDYPKIPFKRMKVKIWTFEEQQKYIEDRVKLHTSNFNKKESDLSLCTKEERWKKEDKWAVYKGTNKTATRLLDTEVEAVKLSSYITKKTKKLCRIEQRPGFDLRCTSYCLVNKFCEYYKENYGEREESKSNS